MLWDLVTYLPLACGVTVAMEPRPPQSESLVLPLTPP